MTLFYFSYFPLFRSFAHIWNSRILLKVLKDSRLKTKSAPKQEWYTAYGIAASPWGLRGQADKLITHLANKRRVVIQRHIGTFYIINKISYIENWNFEIMASKKMHQIHKWKDKVISVLFVNRKSGEKITLIFDNPNHRFSLEDFIDIENLNFEVMASKKCIKYINEKTKWFQFCL